MSFDSMKNDCRRVLIRPVYVSISWVFPLELEALSKWKNYRHQSSSRMLMSFDTKKWTKKDLWVLSQNLFLQMRMSKVTMQYAGQFGRIKRMKVKRKIANIKSSRRNIIFNDFLLEHFLSYFSQLNNRTSVKQNISEIYFIQCKNRK